MSKTSLLSLLFLIGCSDSPSKPDSGSPPNRDASTADAGPTARDSGATEDAGSDSGRPDASQPPAGGAGGQGDQDAGTEPPSGGAGGEGGSETAGAGGEGTAGEGEAGSGGDGEAGSGGSGGNAPEMRVIREHLNFPWEIVWGPDDFLWVTERSSFQVSRINPSNGDRHVILELSDGYQVGGQDGLLGMALDPGLLQNSGNDYVYVAYTYNAADPAAAPDRKQKIVRYTYNPTTEQLDFPQPLLLGLPASLDHNGGRLIFGPDGKLYYSIGDQGANQYDRACELNRAQTLPTAPQDFANYPGKTLRINTDGTVPSDNPVLAGVQSHVFTFGHRNHQGLDFAPDGKLYACEHGPKTDDEINMLGSGLNYGWPLILGNQDDRAYAYREWASSSVPCDQLTYSDYSVPPSVPTRTETSVVAAGLIAPLVTMQTVDSDFNFIDPACDTVGSFLCWPTIAPSSLTAYEGVLWPGISLLVTSLKHGLIYRASVTESRVDTIEPMPETETQNRYRDIAVSPDGRSFYVVTDVTGASYVSRGASFEIANPGAILEFRYR